MSQQTTEQPYFGEVIHQYTRAQALADGVLIDAGPMARETGFRRPVAITSAAWRDCVAWTDSDNQRQIHQDQSGRLWDVLFMAAYGARKAKDHKEQLEFSLYRVPRDGHTKKSLRTTLKLISGPGDDGEPVITILLPNED